VGEGVKVLSESRMREICMSGSMLTTAVTNEVVRFAIVIPPVPKWWERHKQTLVDWVR
jgi:hypothetical protein